MKKKSFFYPIIFMSLLTAVFALILASLDYTTADRIELLQGTELREKILHVFDIPVTSQDPNEIEDLFQEHVKEDNSFEPAVYYTLENGDVTAYAVPVSGAGLWGSIEGYIGLSADFKEILGLEFTAHSETPGLGGRISEPAFLGQFKNLDISDAQGSEYVVYKPAPGGNVDAVSGATLTSKSVSVLLNEDISNFIKEKRG